MKHLFKGMFLGAGIALTTGCTAGNLDSFTFTTDMPPNFTYEAVAEYVPAKGETCTVKKPDIGYNQRWRLDHKERYTNESEIQIYRTAEGCKLVIYRISLSIYASYGKDRGDFGAHSAVVAIREGLKEETKGKFDGSGVSTFNGQCQWLFRTQGPKRRLSKSIKCKDVNSEGVVTDGRPVVAYAIDQLPGNTVKLKIELTDEEIPSIGDTWVKFHNGWKRCLGKGMEDQYAFCFKNHKDFSAFIMPDGRSCTIYPGCTE